MKVIITGASKGIGRGIATFLARSGYEVGLLARSTDLLEAVKTEIEKSGGCCAIKKCDLSNPDKTQKAIQNLTEQLKGLDALVNNARTGYSQRCPYNHA